MKSRPADLPTDAATALEQQGFYVIEQALSGKTASAISRELEEHLTRADISAIRTHDGVTYAARNVQDWFPAAVTICNTPQVVELLLAVLGEECGLVRVLYFDKPPQQSWSLPWHKDMTIAVEDNSLPSSQFCNPTTKAGVAHVEAPEWLLERMLTLRLHLDAVGEDNGPLRVLTGSHRAGKANSDGGEIATILARQGDVLAMRPLLAHSSPASVEGNRRRRRILHFEFAGQELLPDGYKWRTFVKPTCD